MTQDYSHAANADLSTGDPVNQCIEQSGMPIASVSHLRLDIPGSKGSGFKPGMFFGS